MLLFALVIAGILLLGGWQVQQGILTPGALAAFVIYLVTLAGSIHGMERRGVPVFQGRGCGRAYL